MLDFNHIYSVISAEWQNYSAGVFFNFGLLMWMAHKISNLAKSEGTKVFWMMFSLLLLNDVLQSNTILFDYRTYVSISIFFTHFDLISKPIKAFKQKLKQRAYNKYRKCVDRNDFIQDLEAKEEREKELIVLEDKKQKQQERFLNNLSKRLDSF